MGKNTFLNILMTIFFLTFIIAVILIVNAFDYLRFAIEDLRKNSGTPRMGAVQNVSVPSSPVSRQTETEKAANVQYYDPKAEEGGRLITAFSSDVGNMNSIITNDAYVSKIWERAADTLAERDYSDAGSGSYKPKMAESWKCSPDKLRWRIRLRKGILWHDFKDPVTGKEWKNKVVTAHDFKFYVDVIKDPKVDAAPMRSYLADLDRIEVFDDFEFDVVWRKPYFLSEDITLTLSPLPRHLYHAYEGPFDGAKFNDDHQRNRMVVGCGPYRFEKWEKGRRIVLRRFENYYGKSLGIRPALETLAFDIIQHPNTRLQSLISEDLDMDGLTPDQWINRTGTKEFAPHGKLRKIRLPSFAYSYIGLNQNHGIFKDKKVRQALSHLIDRKKLLKDVYFGLASHVTGPFSEHSSACDRNLKPYEFSVEKAKRILAEQGWKDTDHDGILEKDGQKLRFTVIFPGSASLSRKMLPMIKEDMAKAGVQMDLLGIEWSVLVKRLEEKQFEACLLGWTGSLKPDPFQLWHSSQADVKASSNHCSYRNPEADKIIEELRTSFDPVKRTELYHRFHRIIYEDAPYIFLFAPSGLVVIHSRYQNVKTFRDQIAKDILWVPGKEQKLVPGF